MSEKATAHDRDECGPYCPHPDHFVQDADVDVGSLVRLQLVSDSAHEPLFMEM